MSLVYAAYADCGCNMGAHVIDRHPIDAARFALEMEAHGFEVVAIPVEDFRERASECEKHAQVPA